MPELDRNQLHGAKTCWSPTYHVPVSPLRCPGVQMTSALLAVSLINASALLLSSRSSDNKPC